MSHSLQNAINQAVAQYIQLQGTTFSATLYQDIMSQVEKQLIEIVMTKTHGNKSKSAKILGISRVTLSKKIQILGIDL
ncbi:helix-turn-helix domain-containing protein [Gammaproteobacteria bacterium]|nr:helix-turn-helix domain-containing protein [Gammaproteobacteria bacterium]